MTLADKVHDHLVTRFGTPDQMARFVAADADIEVLKWSRPMGDLGVTLYCTLGASRQRAPGSRHRVEYCIGLSQPRDEIAKVLAELAAEPIRGGSFVAEGHSVTFPGPLWPRTRMTCLLVTRFPIPVVPDLRRPFGTHVRFLSVVPLYPEELAAKQRLGFEAFWAAFKARQVDIANPRRPPVVFPVPGE